MTIDNLAHQLKQKQAASQADSALQLYALIDSAQDVRIPTQLDTLVTTPLQTRCLLEGGDSEALHKAAPHLVALPALDTTDKLWRALAHNAPLKPGSITVIASALSFEALFAHLAPWTEVVMPDNDEMIFAYWDSAIFATLIGQTDDETLHVPGPVLTAPQAAALMAPIAGLWYWDRTGQMHLADTQTETQTNQGAASKANTEAPIKLTQVQVDMLVEASVPDSLVLHLKETQPALLGDMNHYEQYTSVKAHLLAARQLGLRNMRDLIDYVCAGLIYKERMKTDDVIAQLLQKVKAKQLKLTSALEQFP